MYVSMIFYICVIKISGGKKAMNLNESEQGYIECFRGAMGKGEK